LKARVDDTAGSVRRAVGRGGPRRRCTRTGRWRRRWAACAPRGRAVQVGPIKPMLKAPGSKLLDLTCDKPLSKFAFKFNLRRYSVAVAGDGPHLPRAAHAPHPRHRQRVDVRAPRRRRRRRGPAAVCLFGRPFMHSSPLRVQWRLPVWSKCTCACAHSHSPPPPPPT